MKRNLPLLLGTTLLLALLISAIIGAALNDPQAYNLADALHPPSKQHLLGCDAFGADLAHLLLAGAWRSLSISLLVTSVTLLMGLAIGTGAALAPTPLATMLTRVIDCFLAFPGLLLAILIASIMPNSNYTVLIALCIAGWTGRARFCRTLVRQIAAEPYIEAAIASGATRFRVIVCHIWPMMIAQLTVQAALAMGNVIIGEASLSFLGFAGSAGNASWGRLIAEGREYLVEAPHLSLFPGMAFVLAVLAFNLTAEGIRRRLANTQSQLY